MYFSLRVSEGVAGLCGALGGSLVSDLETQSRLLSFLSPFVVVNWIGTELFWVVRLKQSRLFIKRDCGTGLSLCLSNTH